MISWALVVVGVGEIVVGLGHAALPPTLRWRRDTFAPVGELTELVVRMHVYFIGLFLVAFGVLSVAVGVSVPSGVGRAFGITAAAVFGLRAAAEFALVGRVVSRLSAGWRWLHRAAWFIWPALVVVYIFGATLTPGG